MEPSAEMEKTGRGKQGITFFHGRLEKTIQYLTAIQQRVESGVEGGGGWRQHESVSHQCVMVFKAMELCGSQCGQGSEAVQDQVLRLQYPGEETGGGPILGA